MAEVLFENSWEENQCANLITQVHLEDCPQCLSSPSPQPFYDPFSGTTRVRNFWALWCKGRLTGPDTLTNQLGATPSILTSAHLHRPPIFYRLDTLPAAQPTVTKH